MSKRRITMKKYINRYNISMTLAIIGTILSAIGWVGLMRGSQSAASFITFGILIAMLAYVFGGLLTALRMASSIAKWGIFFDRFPFNLLNMLASFVLAILVFLCFPVIPVMKARKQYQRV